MPDAAEEADVVVNGLGRRLHVDPADARGAELRARSGDVNQGSMRLWRVLVARGGWDVVLDVGANYGEMLLGVDLSSVPIVAAYEPNPRVLPYLQRSIADAGVAHVAHPLAVADRDGATLVFAIDTEWSGTSGLVGHRGDRAEHRVEEVEVHATTLDAQLVELGVADDARVLVKVDVEGAEAAVLAGAATLLARTGWAMMLETIHMPLDEQVALLERFDVVALDLATGELVRVPSMSTDALARLLETGWLHGQDLALLGSDASGLRSAVEVVAEREAVIRHLRDRASQLSDVEHAMQVNAGFAAEHAAWMRSELDRLEDALGHVGDHRDAIAADRDHHATLAAEAVRARDAATAERDAMRASTSWRVTRPLRALRTLARRR